MSATSIWQPARSTALGIKCIISSVVFALVFTNLTFAQLNVKGKTIIHYRDGSVFIGDVISNVYPVIKFRITTGDTLSLFTGQIKKMQRPDNITVHNKGKFHFIDGNFGIVALSLGSGSVQAEANVLKRLEDKFAVGVGTSLAYSDFDVAGTFIGHDFFTLHGIGRYYLNNNRIRAFTDLRLGYGFSRDTFLAPDHSGGIHAQPGIGIIFPSRGSFRWFFAISQFMQYTRGTQTEFGPFQTPFVLEYNVLHNRTLFKFGLEFK